MVSCCLVPSQLSDSLNVFLMDCCCDLIISLSLCSKEILFAAGLHWKNTFNSNFEHLEIKIHSLQEVWKLYSYKYDQIQKRCMQWEAHLKAKKTFKCNWIWTFLCEYVSSGTFFVEVVVSQHETCTKKAQKPLWFCRQDVKQTFEQTRHAQMSTIAICRWQKWIVEDKNGKREITSPCSFQQVRLRKCAFFVTFF